VLGSSQEQIIKACELAGQKGDPAKAEILEKFIIGDTEHDGQQINTRRKPRFTAKHFDRRGSLETDRTHKASIVRLSHKQGASLSQDQSKLSFVPGERPR
jgi:hypothetical protein